MQLYFLYLIKFVAVVSRRVGLLGTHITKQKLELTLVFVVVVVVKCSFPFFAINSKRIILQNIGEKKSLLQKKPRSIIYPTPSVYKEAHALEEGISVFFFFFFSYLKLIGCSCLKKLLCSLELQFTQQYITRPWYRISLKTPYFYGKQELLY